MLEQTVIEFLEKRDNLEFGKTLLYEHKDNYVRWVDTQGKPHTYIPDLYDTINDIVYEVKPQWLIESETEEMRRKRLAVEQTRSLFRYISDVSVIKKERKCP